MSKKGVIKGQHAIIYTSKTAPKPQATERAGPGEAPMLTPIRVRPKKKMENLDPMARVNFGKLYTVEHNVKVYDFGDVHKDHIRIFTAQWKWVLGCDDQRGEEEEEYENEEDEDENG